jgi:hypothetical protein
MRNPNRRRNHLGQSCRALVITNYTQSYNMRNRIHTASARPGRSGARKRRRGVIDSVADQTEDDKTLLLAVRT